MVRRRLFDGPVARPPARCDDLARHDLRVDPLARRYQARPVTVQVGFATTAGRLRTLEGEVDHAAGAALVTGQQGESWPVERQAFEARYRPGGGQAMGEPGPYVKRGAEVWARQWPRAFCTRAGTGQALELQGRPGDWLVQYGDGTQGIVAQALFDGLYETS